VHWYEAHGIGKRDFRIKSYSNEHELRPPGSSLRRKLWKIYKMVRDDDARSEGLLRVIDESGEDYLFSEENFVPIELPKQVQEPFDRAVRELRRVAARPRTSGLIKRARGRGSAV
jgi:hypothetical protein